MDKTVVAALSIREISYGSQDYQATVALRYAILREPLGLRFTPEQLRAEHNQHHIACYYQGALVACLILNPVTRHHVNMRQVAVTPALQTKGVGKTLLRFAEQFARQHHYSIITLHARKTAIPFYEKQGYKCEGEFFEEISLPHKKMSKSFL